MDIKEAYKLYQAGLLNKAEFEQAISLANMASDTKTYSLTPSNTLLIQ